MGLELRKRHAVWTLRPNSRGPGYKSISDDLSKNTSLPSIWGPCVCGAGVKGELRWSWVTDVIMWRFQELLADFLTSKQKNNNINGLLKQNWYNKTSLNSFVLWHAPRFMCWHLACQLLILLDRIGYIQWLADNAMKLWLCLGGNRISLSSHPLCFVTKRHAPSWGLMQVFLLLFHGQPHTLNFYKHTSAG